MYPTITFVSRKTDVVDDGQFKLKGDITIRGITREVVLDIERPIMPVKQGPMLRTGGSATTRINRREFGPLCGWMFEGAAVVGDESRSASTSRVVRRAN